jgi:hypothetical protein
LIRSGERFLIGFFFSVSLSLSNSIALIIKGGKASNVQFIRDPSGADGKPKGKRILVAPGLDRNTGLSYCPYFSMFLIIIIIIIIMIIINKPLDSYSLSIFTI